MDLWLAFSLHYLSYSFLNDFENMGSKKSKNKLLILKTWSTRSQRTNSHYTEKLLKNGLFVDPLKGCFHFEGFWILVYKNKKRIEIFWLVKNFLKKYLQTKNTLFVDLFKGHDCQNGWAKWAGGKVSSKGTYFLWVCTNSSD